MLFPESMTFLMAIGFFGVWTLAGFIVVRERV
jgi:hypothetical protein